ncbi:MAG: hypothetical protein U5L07_11050 [Desulfobacterales bacterium]|nr:hypothetical protein [Desulfobacterales bacterium]
MTIIIITGMHRSGTSLISSYLQYCGLDIGEQLIGGNKGNTKGHFEDKEFVDLHNRILNRNNINYLVPAAVTIQQEDIEKATQILYDRNHIPVWGWKDPRTVLFLDFWHKLLGPNVFYIFIYRKPQLVVDSLLRRNTDKILRRKPWLAAEAWIYYNSLILNFIKNNLKSSLLFQLEEIIFSAPDFIRKLNNKAGLSLEHKELKFIFDKNAMGERVVMKKSKLINRIFKSKHKRMMNDLEQYKTKLI